MRLHLIRHGRTPANVNHLLDTAAPGLDLDDEGMAQAAAVVEKFEERPIEALYVSPKVRTQQTAAPLAERFGLEPVVLDGLAEIKAGDLEMWPGFSQYLAVIGAWAAGDLANARPGGEDGIAFMARFDEAIATIAAAGHAEAAAVSHAGALGTWLAARAGGPTYGDDSGRLLGNTAVVTVEGDPDQGWTIVEWDNGASWFVEDEVRPGTRTIDDDEAERLAPGWQVLHGRLQQVWKFPTFRAAADFVAKVADHAEQMDHHPDLSWRYDRVHVGVSSHDSGGITHRDTAMAGRFTAIAGDLDATPQPEELQQWQFADDIADEPAASRD